MKTILLTGASGGIGFSIRQILESEGHAVITTDRHEYDLTSPEAIAELATKVGPIDTIVCAHGYIDTANSFAEQSIEALQKTFAVNTLSVAYLARQFPDVDMITLSSTSALSPNGKYPAYSASKAAVNVLMQNLARHRPERLYITICPGATNTKMREKIAHDAAQHQSPNEVASLVADILSGKEAVQTGDIWVVRDGVRSRVSGA